MEELAGTGSVALEALGRRAGRRAWSGPRRTAAALARFPDARGGVDPADLAAATGHTVAVATAVYVHSTGTSWDAMRSAVG